MTGNVYIHPRTRLDNNACLAVRRFRQTHRWRQIVRFHNHRFVRLDNAVVDACEICATGSATEYSDILRPDEGIRVAERDVVLGARLRANGYGDLSVRSRRQGSHDPCGFSLVYGRFVYRQYKRRRRRIVLNDNAHRAYWVSEGVWVRGIRRDAKKYAEAFVAFVYIVVQERDCDRLFRIVRAKRKCAGRRPVVIPCRRRKVRCRVRYLRRAMACLRHSQRHLLRREILLGGVAGRLEAHGRQAMRVRNVHRNGVDRYAVVRVARIRWHGRCVRDAYALLAILVVVAPPLDRERLRRIPVAACAARERQRSRGAKGASRGRYLYRRSVARRRRNRNVGVRVRCQNHFVRLRKEFFCDRQRLLGYRYCSRTNAGLEHDVDIEYCIFQNAVARGYR